MSNAEIMVALMKINGVFNGVLANKEAVTVWQNALAPYSERDVNKAIDDYIHSKPFPPKPADIIKLIPEDVKETYISNRFREDNIIEYVDANGLTHIERTYKCIECRDRGLIMWINKDGCLIGKPCRCEIGKQAYPKAWGEYYGT